jgi:dihydroxyacetone kinase-like predicted kinase
MVAFEATAGARETAGALGEALARVRTGSVAQAARDDGEGRFRTGEAVGFVDDTIVAWGEPDTALRGVVASLAQDAELLTLLEGAGAPLDRAHIEALAPDDVELEFEIGGQPSYWWLLAAE